MFQLVSLEINTILHAMTEHELQPVAGNKFFIGNYSKTCFSKIAKYSMDDFDYFDFDYLRPHQILFKNSSEKNE